MTAESDEQARSEKFDPDVQDPHADGVSRRRLLRSSVAAGTVGATAGRLGGQSGGESEISTTEMPGNATMKSEPANDTTTGSGTTSGPTDGGPTDSETTVYVFNTGDRTMSIIDSTTDDLLGTTMIGTTASFPSNQYTPKLVSAPSDASG
ncbi:hypothetical protein BRD01_07335 [Halobacteriales archaeon QS_8_65_32]|nr:MAG: hypothetical protein BRD01_07335 [Halobacteriales archaeon QS_8_65_32]